MHTFEGKSVRFFHHGDFEGEVVITNKETNEQMIVEMEDLINLVGEKVRCEKIGEIQSKTGRELLGLEKED